jgi:hypothetical protein
MRAITKILGDDVKNNYTNTDETWYSYVTSFFGKT